jgi:hypothetical protein
MTKTQEVKKVAVDAFEGFVVKKCRFLFEAAAKTCSASAAILSAV